MNKLFLFIPLVLIYTMPAYSQEYTNQDLHDAHDLLLHFLLSDNQQVLSLSDTDYLPVVISFVNETSGKLVVGMDNNSTQKIDDFTNILQGIVGNVIPLSVGYSFIIEEKCDLTSDSCVPTMGGIEISNDVSISTLTIPVSTTNGQNGFVFI